MIKVINGKPTSVDELLVFLEKLEATTNDPKTAADIAAFLKEKGIW